MTDLYVPTPAERQGFAGMSVCILTPCKDYEVPAQFARHVANMIAYSWMHGLRVYAMGVSERMVVHWARNHLAMQVKDHVNEHTGERFSHLLWLDDDHVFNPDLLVRLARNPALDVVSALYFSRGGKPLPVVYSKVPSDDPYKHYQIVGLANAVVEVDAIGFGACLMRRDVLDRFPGPWFKFQNGCGEDVYFCVEAKKHGARIWCDGAYTIGHIGKTLVVTEADYKAYVDSDPQFAERSRFPMETANA